MKNSCWFSPHKVFFFLGYLWIQKTRLGIQLGGLAGSKTAVKSAAVVPKCANRVPELLQKRAFTPIRAPSSSERATKADQEPFQGGARSHFCCLVLVFRARGGHKNTQPNPSQIGRQSYRVAPEARIDADPYANWGRWGNLRRPRTFRRAPRHYFAPLKESKSPCPPSRN